MKNVAVLMEDGAFALFFLPHPPGICHPRQKKCLCPGAARAWGGGGQAQLELTDALYEHFHVPGKSRLG